MHVVRAGGVGYYVRELVPGRAEGTGVAGETPGSWTGGGAAVLGLRGEVGPDEFRSLFAGHDPLGDRALRTARGPRAVAGIDLLFCAPKSVSLLHLLGPREVAEAAGAAHEAAVAEAVGHLERAGHGVRRTRGGTTHRLATTGAVSAGFVHRTSRALDPHLHTHVVVANVAQGVDGVWSSLDTRRLFASRRSLGVVYDSALRSQLSGRLGVAWERGTSGRWDVVGVDPVLARVFSQRTASIDEHDRRRGGGRSTPGSRRVAFHADRPAKDSGPTVEGLRVEWRRRAADHDLDPADLVRVVGRGRARSVSGAVDPQELVARLGPRVDRRATLSHGDLVAVVADSAPGGLGVGDVELVVAALGRAVRTGRGDEHGSAGGVGPVAAGPGHGGAAPVPREARWSASDVVRTIEARDGGLTAILHDPARGRSQGPWSTGAERTPTVERLPGRALVTGGRTRDRGLDAGRGPTGRGELR